MLHTKQLILNRSQIEAFYYGDSFSRNQAECLLRLLPPNSLQALKRAVDVGGGSGSFASELVHRTHLHVKVTDTDPVSIDHCNQRGNSNIEAVLEDALSPTSDGGEDIVCFNLILHHLVGESENFTQDLQCRAISFWLDKSEYVFVYEYVYDSYLGDFSGRLIYEITRNKLLSRICSGVSKLFPSLRANTFGVGVRFRSHRSWLALFDKCGFDLVSSILGNPERIAIPRRLLLIRGKRRDGFLLRAKSS